MKTMECILYHDFSKIAKRMQKEVMVKSPFHGSRVSIWSNAFVQWTDILSTLGKIWPCWWMEEDPTYRTQGLRPIFVCLFVWAF